MRPDPALVIAAAMKTLDQVAIELTDEQHHLQLRSVTALLSILQSEWDTCASDRLAGIARYADIARRGAVLVEGERRERLSRVLAAVDDGSSDFRISSLEASLDLLRAAIVDLQEWVEEMDGPAERALRDDIWQAEYEDARSQDRNTPLW